MLKRLLPCLLVVAAVLACASGVSSAPDDPEQKPIDVYDWSIWVGSPAQSSINAARFYQNAMPGVVGTSRPKFEDKAQTVKFPLAPVSIVQFFGQECRDVDVDLRTKKGPLVSHWPAGSERTGRVQWFKSSLSATPPADIPLGYIPETHWFQKLRAWDSALYLKNESHLERFIAYDAELSISVPVKIRGGPDEYTLQNLTDRPLRDVAVVAPTEGGFRVGWLDELAAGTSDKKEDEPQVKKPAEPDLKKKAKADSEKAKSLFEEAEAKGEEKPKEKKDKIPPLPAEADADIRARVDQVLNRQVTVRADQAPRRDLIGVILGQVRLGYDIDDKTLAKEEIDLSQTMEINANGVSARDALADVLGGASLSYRVTDQGRLFITTAARLAEEAGAKGKVIEGPPVKLLMSQPLKPSDPTYREMTREALARRLAAQGMRDDITRFVLDQYGQTLFEPGELVVLAHFSRDAIDDAMLLDVFPPPRKFVRVALVLIHGVDPRLQDRARAFVKELGDASPKTREAAERRLFELGSVAVPALEDALLEKDVEIVFRAERLLLRLNRPVP
jgi:hypothetical protein